MGFELESSKSTALPSLSPKTTEQFNRMIGDLTGKGWKITTDGASGTQLAGPKKMSRTDKVCLWFGILTAWFGIGILFIMLALIDYWFLTKPQTQFVTRPTN